MENPSSKPDLAIPDSARRKQPWFGKVVLGGCVGCLGIAVVIASVFVGLFFWGRKSLTPVAEEFLNTVESGEYQQAYDEIGSPWRATASLKEFSEVLDTVQESLGKRRSLRGTGFHYNGNEARAVYSAEFENGPATLTVTFIKEQGEWRIAGIHFDSELLGPILRCPFCAHVNDLGAKFCADCGRSLEKLDETGEETI